MLVCTSTPYTCQVICHCLHCNLYAVINWTRNSESLVRNGSSKVGVGAGMCTCVEGDDGCILLWSTFVVGECRECGISLTSTHLLQCICVLLVYCVCVFITLAISNDVLPWEQLPCLNYATFSAHDCVVCKVAYWSRFSLAVVVLPSVCVCVSGSWTVVIAY